MANVSDEPRSQSARRRPALVFEGSKKPGDQDEPESEKPQIYSAWMRKPGDPDYEEDEGETAGGGGGTSTLSEPVISDPEPPPRSAMPEVVPQSPTVRPGANMTNRVVEPGEPHSWVPGARFGRFQGS